MDIGPGNQIGKIFRLMLLTLLMLIIFLPFQAQAIQWKKLAQTSRHNVALEMSSIKNLSDGNFSIWLRFTPRGVQQRREAATDYGFTKYYQHLEYYEINCLEQSASLKRIIILAKNRQEIKQLTYKSSSDTIIPGSALDFAATIVCPTPDFTPADDTIQQDLSALSGNEIDADEEEVEENNHRIAESKTATAADPGNFKKWAELGNAYYDADIPQDAIEAYNQALKLKPENIEVLNDQGAMFRRIGDFKNAIKNYERVLAIDPKNRDSLYSIGYIYAIELNHNKEAIPFWQRYLVIDTSSETSKQLKQYISKYDK